MENSLRNTTKYSLQCPFLQNINEPVSKVTTKGPIFEDGPDFQLAFRLFHGQNGVVQLTEKVEPKFNPLAAKAATISLSGFGPFGFDAFFKKLNNQNHESTSNEWLNSGNCPMAKSYRAISNVLPMVAKALQPPSGMKLKCPSAIIAARAFLSRTAFAKKLRPQPLSEKVIVIGMMGMAANVPLGIWREHTKKFSPSWFAAVHAAVPFIAMLRKSVLMPKSAMAFTIAASILGQVIGSRAERYRLQAKLDSKELSKLKGLFPLHPLRGSDSSSSSAADVLC
ncbi:uncharacterized protein LOC124929223 [Impatiens glandulifera]|uniref:uncharacterized protein LOC124929223 n=1 Tax=Impatiens glandulifera TaxID=253017 RepID=UPI001FB0D956|nr:uncharacterized protein LOC124929223 [Impatiens glandulifera]